MTSSGHVTSSGECTIDSTYASSYWLYIETIPLSGVVSEIFSPKVATMIIRDDVISDVIRPGLTSTIREDHMTHHIAEHCVKVSSNSDKNCRRGSILKENDDVTIMTSSGHVTSSGLCAIDSP